MKIWYLAALTGLACITAFAQPLTPPKYVQIDYMKVEPGKGGEYLRAVRELWKPIHEERVKKGLILAWGIAGMRYPAGASREYDYVTATYYDRFAGCGSHTGH